VLASFTLSGEGNEICPDYLTLYINDKVIILIIIIKLQLISKA
jgi:hypothetical protein